MYIEANLYTNLEIFRINQAQMLNYAWNMRKKLTKQCDNILYWTRIRAFINVDKLINYKLIKFIQVDKRVFFVCITQIFRWCNFFMMYFENNNCTKSTTIIVFKKKCSSIFPQIHNKILIKHYSKYEYCICDFENYIMINLLPPFSVEHLLNILRLQTDWKERHEIFVILVKKVQTNLRINEFNE